MFVSVIDVDDISMARVLVTALKAHGFHPLEGGEAGLPGMPGIMGVKGTISIQVPEGEMEDAKLLAGVLLAEMRG